VGDFGRQAGITSYTRARSRFEPRARDGKVPSRLERRIEMATGIVKWFNDAKGFGFVKQEGGGEDVFCHQSAIQATGFRSLTEGQKVEFEVTKGPKGLQASNVRVIS